jgi:hypothetical protein
MKVNKLEGHLNGRMYVLEISFEKEYIRWNKPFFTSDVNSGISNSQSVEVKNFPWTKLLGQFFLLVMAVEYLICCNQRWNSRTNSWVEVSGHNLESS